MSTLTLTEIKTLFTSVTTESTWWSKFTGSEFVTYLCTFVAQVYFRANQLSARRLQEAFLSLALNDSSILAHAESKGYVPTKRVPTKVTIYIENTSDATVYISKYTSLYSSDTTLNYLITSALTIEAGETLTTECEQAEVSYYEYEVETEEKYLTEELDSTTSDEISELNVYIEDTDGNTDQWESSYLFRNTSSDSQVYVEYYTSDELLGVRFGNGVSGAIPELSSVITLECITTDGFTEISAGLTLTFDDDDDLNDSLTVTTGETLVVGSEREEIESIRSNALYHTSYDNTVVYDNDYSYFTNKNIDGLTWFSVWGEKEQENLTGESDLDNLGKVFLSAYHPDYTQTELMALIDELYSSVDQLNVEYEAVECVELAFTLELNATILSTNKPSLVSTVVINALTEAYSSSSSEHGGSMTANEIWKTLEDLDLLTNFDVVISADLTTDPDINTFRYLDVDNSTINISY